MFALTVTLTGDEPDNLMCDVLPGSLMDDALNEARRPEVEELQRNHELFAEKKGVSPMPFEAGMPVDYVVVRYVKTRTIVGMSSYLDTASEAAPFMGVSPSVCQGMPGGHVPYFGVSSEGVGRVLLTCVEAFAASQGHNHFKLKGIGQAYGFWRRMALERGGRMSDEEEELPGMPLAKFFFWAPPRPGYSNEANLYQPPDCN